MEYSILGYRGNFKIDKDSGQIRLAQKLDYETQKGYTFVVRATYPYDPEKFTQTTVNVDVQDVNDNRPVFERYEEKITVDVVIMTIDICYSYERKRYTKNMTWQTSWQLKISESNAIYD